MAKTIYRVTVDDEAKTIRVSTKGCNRPRIKPFNWWEAIGFLAGYMELEEIFGDRQRPAINMGTREHQIDIDMRNARLGITQEELDAEEREHG